MSRNPNPPSSKRKKTRVLIVDDHPVIREGVKQLISRQSDLDVCGEAAGAAEALQLASKLKPDVAIIDIGLKDGNGIDLVRRLKEKNPSLRALVWSMHGENHYAERALRAGALGFVAKDEAIEQIVEAIRQVRKGKLFLRKDRAEQMLASSMWGKQAGTSAALIENLSDRELEVFRLLGQAKSTREVAEKMHISAKTVETYRTRIKEKLNLKNVRELFVEAAYWLSAAEHASGRIAEE